MKSWVDIYKANFRLVVFLVFTGSMVFAWSNRFILDDAFISFRYAYNLAHGDGLVWSQGVRVEGYTNFLWTVLISMPIRFGFDPKAFSFFLGLISFALSLVFSYKLTLLLTNSRNAALLVLVFLGSNYTFSSFATGGLETPMQACLFVICMYLAVSFVKAGTTPRKLFILSVVGSAALLTRLDSAVLLAVVFPAAIIVLLRERTQPRQKVIRLLCLFLPIVIIVGAWFWWKAHYYGDIIPNTYYAKVLGGSSRIQGAKYVMLFFYSYLLFPIPLFLLYAAGPLFKKQNSGMLLVMCATLLWLAYLIYVGGDFMEFRLVAPILPFFFVATSWLISTQVENAVLKVLLVVLILSGSLHHFLTFYYPLQIESVGLLRRHVENENENWIGIGKTLGEAFNYDRTVLIATTAAGAIPFYSRLDTVDMFGPNDRWVARNGVLFGDRPGHQRLAPFSYLMQRGVNVLIAFPQLVNSDAQPPEFKHLKDALREFQIPFADRDVMPRNPELIEIPIDARHKLLVIYLTPHPRVDQAIRRNNWRWMPLGVG
jgi:arabinofuranosyltransferase